MGKKRGFNAKSPGLCIEVKDKSLKTGKVEIKKIPLGSLNLDEIKGLVFEHYGAIISLKQAKRLRAGQGIKLRIETPSPS